MTDGILAVLRAFGRLAVGGPEPLRASGGYGLASRGALILLYGLGALVVVVTDRMSSPGPVIGATAGLTLMFVTGAGLVRFLLLQYRGALRTVGVVAWLGAVVAVLLAVPFALPLNLPRPGTTGGFITSLLSTTGGLVGVKAVEKLFAIIFGPHHPESTLPELEVDTGLWFWTGVPTEGQTTVVARVDENRAADIVSVELKAFADQSADADSLRAESPVDENGLARVTVNGLTPGAGYDLLVTAHRDGRAVATASGSVNGPADDGDLISLVFGSCLSTGSRGQVFDTIGQLTPRPAAVVITGDLHYQNLTDRDPERFLDAFDKVHASPVLRRLFSGLPMAYVWDDHDFGDNDSGHNSPARTAAQTAYRMAVPHQAGPALGSGQTSGPIDQAFTVGRTKVVMTDNRSNRGATTGNLLSAETEQWLIDELTDPDTPFVIWVSPTPWISDEATGDNWGAYPRQRQRIAEAIDHRRHNLLMVSGDAHMLAIDDGTNSRYVNPERRGVDPGRGFPVFHAAALDRLGSAKGGPFSHGELPGAGQFGLVTIDDQGDRITVTLSGRNWTNDELVGHTFTVLTVDDRQSQVESGSVG